MGWVDSYLNQPSVKAELGVSPQREFSTCNTAVNLAFMLSGDWSNSALLLPELVNDGVRLLVYAGNAGQYCFYLFIYILGLYSTFVELRIRSIMRSPILCYLPPLITAKLGGTAGLSPAARYPSRAFFAYISSDPRRSCGQWNIKHVSGSLGIASVGIIRKKRSITKKPFSSRCRCNCIDFHLSWFPVSNLRGTGTQLTIYLFIIDLLCNYIVSIILYLSHRFGRLIMF